MLHQRLLAGLCLVLVGSIMLGGCKAGLTPDDIIPPTLWMRTFGGYLDDSAVAISTDNFGNMFIAGVFSGSSDFDPGPGDDIRIAGGSQDIFLTKYDSHGEYLWARTWGIDVSIWEEFPVSDDYTCGVVSDASGNVYVAGLYADATFNSEKDPELLDADCFLRKFDSSGSLIYERQWGGDHQDQCGAVAIDSQGNIYIMGAINGLADLDPGEGEAIYGVEDTETTYLLKLDSEGIFVWGITWDEYLGWISGMLISGSDKVYISGGYSLTTDFEPGQGVAEMTSSGPWDAFLCCLDTGGEYLWSLGWGNDKSDNASGIASDATGNIYLTGNYKGVIDLNPGPGVELHGAVDERGAYLMKLDSSGGFQWARAWDSTSSVYSQCICVDCNDIYVSGFFSGTGDFLPGPGHWDLTAAESPLEYMDGFDTYLSKFNTAGEFQWAYGWNVGDESEYSKGISVSDNGCIYIMGAYSIPLDYFYSVPKGTIARWSYFDVFLLRYPPYAEL